MTQLPLRSNIIIIEPDGRVHGECPECGWDTNLVTLLNSDNCAFCHTPAAEHPDGQVCYKDTIYLCPNCAGKSKKLSLKK